MLFILHRFKLMIVMDQWIWKGYLRHSHNCWSDLGFDSLTEMASWNPNTQVENVLSSIMSINCMVLPVPFAYFNSWKGRTSFRCNLHSFKNVINIIKPATKHCYDFLKCSSWGHVSNLVVVTSCGDALVCNTGGLRGTLPLIMYMELIVKKK